MGLVWEALSYSTGKSREEYREVKEEEEGEADEDQEEANNAEEEKEREVEGPKKAERLRNF